MGFCNGIMGLKGSVGLTVQETAKSFSGVAIQQGM